MCGSEHAATVCTDCLAGTRDDLRALVDLYRMLPSQAMRGGRDGRLAAAAPIIGGNAMVLAGPAASYDKHTRRRWVVENSKGPARLEQREDELDSDLEPVAYTLDAWEWMYRQALGLERPETPQAVSRYGQGALPDVDKPSLNRAFRFLDDHLQLFAGLTNPAFDDLARDLKQQRRRLEDQLSAGERDARSAVACPNCGVYYVRVFEPVRPCTCDPIRLPDGSTTQLHRRHGGLRDELECPRCHRTITMGEYVYLVGEDYRDNAAYLPEHLLEERIGVPAATIRVWARVGAVQRQGRDGYGRQLYDVADAIARAHATGLCGCPPVRPHAEHIRKVCCLQCHADQTCWLGPHATPGSGVVAS